MKVVEVEPVLSEEMLTIYYMSEERIDFRELVKNLAGEFECRIEMRQVGARDEARLVADYERCGQHCCCQNFLKVLKPVSMRSAKTQKATLDPLKISGRCGRLMCCLRYEDETYEDLKKRLPHRKTRVGTPEGPGIVLDTKILVQLALVQLEEDGRQIAVPIEDLGDPDAPRPTAEDNDPLRGLDPDTAEAKTSPKRRQRRGRKSKEAQQDTYREQSGEAPPERPGDGAPETGDPPKKKRRRRRRRKSGGDSAESGPNASENQPRSDQGSAEGGSPGGEADGSAPRKKRRRRRRRRRGGGGGESGGDGGGSGD